MSYDYNRTARDFPTQEALREYLHEHPGADTSKHRVEKSEAKDPREYARERAKHAPTKKPSFVGVPRFHAASELIRRVASRFLEAFRKS